VARNWFRGGSGSRVAQWWFDDDLGVAQWWSSGSSRGGLVMVHGGLVVTQRWSGLSWW